MIPFKEIMTLAKALPKCGITHQNDSGVSFIIDREGNKVGDIYWREGEVSIYEDYEYCDNVIDAIGKDKFRDTRKYFEGSGNEPVVIENNQPTLTDYGKQLYDMERDPNPELEYQISKEVKE